jgi:diadenosine tetraphosphatase ApaH/serine/threonine PP2A family protein phosphatase
VIDRVRALNPEVVIRGNHDKVAAGIEDGDGFNTLAREAARWTFDTLTDDNRAYLAALPVGPKQIDEFFEICHGSPFDEDAYVFDALDAVQALRASDRPVCIFGHTHQPVVFTLTGNGLDILPPMARDDLLVELRAGTRYLINPGSVGQPRDGDARAAYAMLDTSRKEIVFRRVEYDVHVAQAKITAAGLPPGLAHRLALGR